MRGNIIILQSLTLLTSEEIIGNTLPLESAIDVPII